MDHVVYLDTAAGEMEAIRSGAKTMIIRGAMGRKMPYGRVNTGDTLYFMNNDGDGFVKLKAATSSVFNSDALSGEGSRELIEKYQPQLRLTEKQASRWGGKRYLILIGVEEVEEIPPFKVDRSGYGNMDDWLPVGSIDTVRIVP